jgi:type IV pilus assembly protein PilC
MRDLIEDGSNLWPILAQTNILPENMINLVKIGEKSGRLDENLQLVSKQLQKDRSFKSKVRSAMLYPAVILVTCLIVGLLVAWFILPKLSKVFANMGTDIPLPTQILINIGAFAEQYGGILVPTIIVTILMFIFLFTTVKSVSKFGYNVLFFIPVVRKLLMEVEIGRLGFVIGTLLNSGFTILEALDLLQTSTRSYSFKKMYIQLAKNIEDGRPLSKAIELSKYAKKFVPIQVKQMIIAGEQSGSLPLIMQRVNDIYEEKVDSSAKNLSVVLEPILLVIVALFVLFIAVSVIMPIYGLIGGLS